MEHIYDVCEKCGEKIVIEPNRYLGGGVWKVGKVTPCKCTRDKIDTLAKKMAEIYKQLR